MTWILVVCLGVSTWGGCGQRDVVEFANEAACHKALSTMRLNLRPMGPTAGETVAAYCKPKGEAK